MEQENIEFLPLGSIVQLKGGVKKIMIIARGAFAVVKGEKRYFDYGACTYPEGVIGDALLYFQHKDIQKIVYRGYEDEERTGSIRRRRRDEEERINVEDEEKLFRQ